MYGNFQNPFFARLLQLFRAGLLLPTILAGGESTTAPAMPEESVLQPGIVEEITRPPLLEFEGRSLLRVAFVAERYYDDNVFLNPPGLEIGDHVWEFVPEVFFESSDPDLDKPHYFLAGYNPQLLRYSNLSPIDANNQRGYFQFELNGSQIEAGLSYRFAQFSGTQFDSEDPLFVDRIETDVGRRTVGTSEFGNAFANLPLGDVNWLELAAAGLSRDFDTPGLASSKDTRGEIALIHRFSRKTQGGLGSRFGRFESEGSPDTTYQDLQGLMTWITSPKLSFDAGGGLDFRDFGEGPSGGDATTPIFTAGVDWSPGDSVALSLEGFQRVNSSVNGRSAQRTGFRGVFQYRFLKHLEYSMRGGLERSKFNSSGLDAVQGGAADYYFLTNAIDYEWKDQVSIGIFHEFRKNEANPESSFEQNQFGFRISIVK